MTPTVSGSRVDPMRSHPFRPYKVGAAFRAQTALHAKWSQCGEWRVVESFDDPAHEASLVKEAAGLQDVSAMGKFDVQGARVGDLLAEVSRFDGELPVLRLKPTRALVLTESLDEARVHDELQAALARLPGCAHVTPVSSALSAYRLVGPRAREVLSLVTSLDVRPERFAVGACAQCDVVRVHATIHRTDWNDLPAYLLLVGRDVGEYFWTTLRLAGSPLGLTPFGLAAERLLRPVESVMPSTVSTVS
jgi:heterotetrameric sarcosine oxidase gamma subunit